MRKIAWALFAVCILAAAAWWLWPSAEPTASAQSSGPAVAGAANANEGFVPTERKPSAWVQPVVARGALTLRGRVLGSAGPVAGAQVTATAAHGDDVLSDLACKCDNECGRKLLECGCPEAAGQIVELVAMRTGEAQPVARATTAADGTYLLEGLDADEVALWADASEGVGYLPTARAGQDNADITLAPGRTIEGHVRTATGKPIAGAVVSAINAERSRFFETLTGPDGAFKLGPAPEGQYAVVAMADGLLPDHRNVGQKSQKTVALVLHVPRALSGTVVRGGQPVPAAKVALEGEHRKRKVETDAQGQFVFARLRPGEYELEGSTSDGSGSTSAIVPVDGDRAGVEIELAQGVRLAGVVRDEHGAPVAGAKVYARAARDRSLRETSKEDGTFAFSALPAGMVSIAARANTFLDSEPLELTLEPPGRDGLTLVVRKGAVVSGAVVDEAGQPVEGYSVQLFGLSDGGQRAAFGSPGKDGGFEVTTLPGAYRLTAEANQFLAESREVTAPSSGVRVVMKRGASIEGRVVSESGEPLVGWAVIATLAKAKSTAPEDEFDDYFGRSQSGQAAETTDGGHFLLQGLAAGKVTLSAEGASRSRRGQPSSAARAKKEVELRGTERITVELRVERGLEVAGTVVDGEGKPVAGAMVTAFSSSRERPQYGNATTDDNGAFSISGFQPGKLSLAAVRMPGKGSGELAEAMANSRAVVTAAAGDKRVRIVLKAGKVVVGRVVGEGGKPVAAYDINGRAFDSPDGRFEISAREATSLYMVVTATGYAQAAEKVEIRGDRTDVGDLQLLRGRPVSGRVIEEGTGRPIARALVDVGESRLSPDEGEHYLAERNGAVRTDSQGRFRIPAVDARADRIIATSEDYVTALKPLGPDATQVDIEMKRGTTLRVTVFDREGKAVKAIVVARGQGGRSLGSYERETPAIVKGLTPGTWQVTATGPRGVQYRAVPVQVAGQQELEVAVKEATDGATVTFAVSEGEADRLVAMLVPGRFALPADEAGWRALWALDVQQAREGKFQFVLPGEYTVLVMREADGRTEGFAQTIKVTEQPAQSVTLTAQGGWKPTSFGD